MHIGKWLLRSSNIFCTFFTNINCFIFHESEIRTVLLEVSIDLGLLKKSLLKTSKIVSMYSNSLTRHFSSMFHAKCLLPRLDWLLLVRSCLQNFYQCRFWIWLLKSVQKSSIWINFNFLISRHLKDCYDWICNLLHFDNSADDWLFLSKDFWINAASLRISSKSNGNHFTGL